MANTSSAKKKKDSKLFLIAGGSVFVLLIAVMIFAVLGSSGGKSTKASGKTVTKAYEIKNYGDTRRTDALDGQIRSVKKSVNALPEQIDSLRNEVQEAFGAVNTEFGRTNSDFSKAINDIHINALNERIARLEKPRATVKEIRVVKPSKAASAEPVPARAPRRSGKSIDADAIVGDRAWITVGDIEDSVVAGDAIQVVPKTESVRDVDPTDGVIITSSH